MLFEEIEIEHKTKNARKLAKLEKKKKILKDNNNNRSQMEKET